ncbi:MAG: hypothetical protein NZ601_06410, partial [candidate division WOR-3 bacterium]|nr:hypothetical protein [candidate division WOR-3 bacterium]MDW7987821.1 hypothetical protein [candidate division WOR-3 bacterium]
KNYFIRNNHNVLDIDGARVSFENGWGLIRASNTQPVLVLRFEAKTKKNLLEIQEIFYNQLIRFISIPKSEFFICQETTDII